jgi:hypothetical protein
MKLSGSNLGQKMSEAFGRTTMPIARQIHGKARRKLGDVAGTGPDSGTADPEYATGAKSGSADGLVWFGFKAIRAALEQHILRQGPPY